MANDPTDCPPDYVFPPPEYDQHMERVFECAWRMAVEVIREACGMNSPIIQPDRREEIETFVENMESLRESASYLFMERLRRARAKWREEHSEEEDE